MTDNNTKNVGRTPEVTEIEIIEAGKKLIAKDKTVTSSALRKVLGKGGFERLSRVWTEYEKCQISADNSIELTSEIKKAVDDATSSLSQAFESLVKSMHEKMNSEAQEHITSAINLADSRQKKGDDEMHDAMNFIENLEQTVTTIEESLVISEEVAEELKQTNTELEAVLEKLTKEVQEQYNLLDLVSSENEEVIKTTVLKEAHIETLTQNNTDLKADKFSLQKEVDYLKHEFLNKTKEHDQQIKKTLKKLEDRFDDVA